MAYPYSTPATNMSGYWGDGAYTPPNVVAYIKDDVTPINKNAMVNSVGKQLSLIQNFVNSTYLGRSGVYIQDSYTNNTHVGQLISSGYISSSSIGDITTYSNILPSGNQTADLGSSSLNFDHIYSNTVDTFNVDSNGSLTILSLTGTTLSSFSNILIAGSSLNINSDTLPYANDVHDLGNATFRWKSVIAKDCTFVSGLFTTLFANSVLVGSLLSDDYLSPSNNGTILLGSDIVPSVNAGSNLGASVSHFGNIYGNTIFTSNITAAADLILDASVSIFHIVPKNDIVPFSDGTLSLGLSSKKWGNIVSSGFVFTNGSVDAIRASDWASAAVPGTINLCSDLKPSVDSTAISLGELGREFTNIYTIEQSLGTASTSYQSANLLWVDLSGYVRRGSFPAT